MTPHYCQEHFTTLTYDLAWLPLASIVTFAVAYSMGMGPLPWVMNAELFSKEAQATSASLCASFNWVCSFLVVKVMRANFVTLHTVSPLSSPRPWRP